MPNLAIIVASKHILDFRYVVPFRNQSASTSYVDWGQGQI